jgi:hypothetical protein
MSVLQVKVACLFVFALVLSAPVQAWPPMEIDHKTIDSCDDISRLYTALDNSDHSYFKDWIRSDYLKAKNWAILCVGLAPWHQGERDKRTAQIDKELAFAETNDGPGLQSRTIAEIERRNAIPGQAPPPTPITPAAQPSAGLPSVTATGESPAGAKPKVEIYALFTCVRFSKNMPTPEAGSTRCVEGKVFFRADQCKKEIPAKKGGVTDSNQYARGWVECRESQQESWLPVDEKDGVPRLYKAEAEVFDTEAMTALLAPLEPKARNLIQVDAPFRGSFMGPGNLSFFVVGDGKKVIVFAVSNLNNSQAPSLGAAVGFMKGTEDNLDFEIAAEHVGVKLDYHTEVSGPGAQAMTEAQRKNVYQTMSVTDFVVNGPDLAAKGARVHLSGYYTLNGDVPVLFPNRQAAIVTMNTLPGAGRAPSVPLLIDHASAELRRQLVLCDANPYTVNCNSLDISGIATMCTVSNAFGAARSTPCIDVQHY